MITFVRGDLFADPSLDALAHGCNCAGVMGAGIAVEFKRRFPAMFYKYKDLCKRDKFHVGDVFCWQSDMPLLEPTIFSLGTQTHWTTKASSPGLTKALCMMISMAENLSIKRVGLPRIGAGLGGLDWPTVRAKFEHLGQHTPVELVVFEHYEPGVVPESEGA